MPDKKSCKDPTPIRDDGQLTPREISFILAYRAHPELQNAVNEMLNLPQKEE